MKNKKIIMFFIIILLIIFILWIGILVFKNHKNNQNNIMNEYIPEQEISEEQLRTTNVILYFLKKDSQELGCEIRQIDSKELLNNPEKLLLNLLIDGPNNESFEKIIPENTQIIDVILAKDYLLINFSKEFIQADNMGEEKEKLIIESIVNTVSQLNEINGIKILIEGEENQSFKDGKVNFKNVFTINN